MLKKWIPTLITVLLILSPLCFSSFVVSATPAIGSTTVTLQSFADAYVNSSSPETNYGSEDSLYVSENSKQDFTYVMFDLSSLPPEANIISARLRMHLSATGGDIYGLPSDDIGAYYCSDNSWTENGITWNNRPHFNSEPTDTWSFPIMYYFNYKSWDVTADVKQAFPSGTLTEVLKFESKTGDGYAVFDSKEKDNEPLLEIEYSIEPVVEVHLESSQDTGISNNLGLTTFAEDVFPLPSDVDVVTGTYPVSYNSGYMFTKWETTGGVSVSNPVAATTTVTVTGDGILRAVGNVKQLEYTYDYGYSSYGDSQTEGCLDAVRFTPLFSDQLLKARFYMHSVSSYQPHTIKVHIMDENRNDVITPFEETPASDGWFDVGLSAYNINVNEGTDFYIGLEWLTDYNPSLGVDDTDLSGRSWERNGTSWEEMTYMDFMIRAVVGEENGQTTEEPTTAQPTTDEPTTPETTEPEPAPPSGISLSAEWIAVILSLCGLVAGAGGWIFKTQSAKKRHKILFNKLIEDIDDIYTRFRMNTLRCEAELYKYKDQILEDFKQGLIDEEKYNILDARIDNYLTEVKEKTAKEND